jgi:GLPGLI family protein
MKKIKIILFLITINLYSQNYIHVNYKVLLFEEELTQKSNIEKSKNNNLGVTLDEALNVLKSNSGLITFSLIASKNECVFFRNEIMLPEKISYIGSTVLKVFHNKFFYINSKDDIFYEMINLNSKKYLINYKKEDLEWTITNESKKIQDFNVFKAIGINKFSNEKFFAWFAPELNFNFGPDFSFGLPGLVLEYSLDTYSIVCYQINYNLEKNDLNKLNKPNGEVINQVELDKIIKKSMESFKN